MKFLVTVLHNVGDGMFWAYDPDTASLHEAFTFGLEAGSDDHALSATFDICNSGVGEYFLCEADDTIENKVTVGFYRALQNRSMCVGDVVILRDRTEDHRAYSCDSVGWTRLPDVPDYTATGQTARTSAARLAHIEITEGRRPVPSITAAIAKNPKEGA